MMNKNQEPKILGSVLGVTVSFGDIKWVDGGPLGHNFKPNELEGWYSPIQHWHSPAEVPDNERYVLGVASVQTNEGVEWRYAKVYYHHSQERWYKGTFTSHCKFEGWQDFPSPPHRMEKEGDG